MIERYSIKFGPAVSQKELEKMLNESAELPMHLKLNAVKARIEIVGEIADLKRISNLVKELAKKISFLARWIARRGSASFSHESAFA
jgi:hypothetical protein